MMPLRPRKMPLSGLQVQHAIFLTLHPLTVRYSLSAVRHVDAGMTVGKEHRGISVRYSLFAVRCSPFAPRGAVQGRTGPIQLVVPVWTPWAARYS